MTSLARIIFVDTHTCRIGFEQPDGNVAILDLDFPPDSTPHQVAQRVIETLHQHQNESSGGSSSPQDSSESSENTAGKGSDRDSSGGASGGFRGVVLAIPSQWCLCATVSSDGLPRKKLRQGLLFRMEEHLPTSAEEMVADFITLGDHALGIAVQINQVAPLVEALEAHGLAIEVISTAPLLAAQEAPTHSSAQTAPHVVLWGDQDRLEMVILDAGRPRAWHLLSQNIDELKWPLGIQVLSRIEPLRVTAHNLNPQILEWLQTHDGVTVVSSDDQTLHTAAAVAAKDILSGKTAGLINLRRDALAARGRLAQARTPLIWAAAAILIFLITLNAVMGLQTNRYQRIIATQVALQESVFSQLFPNRPLPINIKSRLASEKAGLASLRGHSSPLPAQTSALELLYRLLSSFPPDMKYRVLELRLDGDKLYLEGQARSHGEADTIAAAITNGSRLLVDQPRTEQLPQGGVSFTITGQAVSEVAADAKLAKGTAP